MSDSWPWHLAATVVECAVVYILLACQVGKKWPMAILKVVFNRIVTAATRTPTLPGLYSLIILAVCVAFGFGLGRHSDLLRSPGWPSKRSRFEVVRGIFITFVAPGVLEEAWFRAALLPVAARGGGGEDEEPGAGPSDCAWALLAFVFYHLNLFHMKDVFRDLRFLLIAAILGVGCTALYFGCGGSLWPPALAHGLAVWTWIYFLGGAEVLGIPAPADEEP